jgi:hypothetical protein
MDTLRVALWAVLATALICRLHVAIRPLGVPLCIPLLTVIAVTVFTAVAVMVVLLAVKMIREGFWLSRAVA